MTTYDRTTERASLIASLIAPGAELFFATPRSSLIANLIGPTFGDLVLVETFGDLVIDGAGE